MRGSGTIGGIYLAAAGLPEFFSRDQGPARKYAFRLFEACALLCRVIFRHQFRGGFPVDFSVFFTEPAVRLLSSVYCRQSVPPKKAWGRLVRLGVTVGLKYAMRYDMKVP